MKPFLPVGILLIFLHLAAADAMATDAAARVRALLATEAGIGSSCVVVARSGHIELEVLTGSSDQNDSTEYHIASVSKVITALTAVKLAERGIVGLDDPVAEILGRSIEDERLGGGPITLRQLLSHTSGLSDQGVPVAPPGVVQNYSNKGYGLVAQALESATGRSYGDLVRENVFVPRGMLTARVLLEGSNEPGGGLNVLPNGAGRVVFGKADLRAFLVGMTSEVQTSDWKQLTSCSIDNLEQPVFMGWAGSCDPRQTPRVFAQSGTTDSSSAEVVFFPREKVAFGVMMRGRYQVHVYEEIRRILSQEFDAPEFPSPKLRKIKELELAGEWESPLGWPPIRVVGGKAMTLAEDSAPLARLVRTSRQSFIAFPIRRHDDLEVQLAKTTAPTLRAVVYGGKVYGVLWKDRFYTRPAQAP